MNMTQDLGQVMTQVLGEVTQEMQHKTWVKCCGIRELFMRLCEIMSNKLFTYLMYLEIYARDRGTATSDYALPNYYQTRRIECSKAAPFARAARTPWHGVTPRRTLRLAAWALACGVQQPLGHSLVMRLVRPTPWSTRRSRARDGGIQLDRLLVEPLVLVPCAAP